MRNYDLGVAIGRFQLFHNGHETLIRRALAQSKRVLVLIGSVNVARSPKNPFTFAERKSMIQRNFEQECEAGRLCIQPLRDFSTDAAWVALVQSEVQAQRSPDSSAPVALFGHRKDASSYYLDVFPQYELVEVPDLSGLSATSLRESLYFSEQGDARALAPCVPDGTLRFLEAFQKLSFHAQLVRETEFLRNYQKPYKQLPYPVIFVTTDAVVTCGGHLLVVRRRAEPGKGLLALPGGFLGYDERILDSAIRELREETRLKVPEIVLRGSLRNQKVFDDPGRSLRGRTITHAFHFELTQPDLPKVRGADDAEKAFWLPFSQFQALDGQMFEDHWSIVSYFLALD